MKRKERLIILFHRLLLTGCLVIPSALFAQQSIEVTGLITDSLQAPMQGVTVSVKSRSTIATSSDMNGRFILAAPSDATLVFSLIGYGTVEQRIQGTEPLSITMFPDVSMLEDVVVVAYGTQKKKEVVGAVTSINPSELKVPSSNLTTALAGRLAGVIAYQRSGEPGLDNAEFFIRGVTTFGYKKDPLILIDGVELSTTELARMQPDDIASFSIMKDATATALYGARGANGVILVTTKEGKVERAKFSFRYENSFSAPTKNVELVDPITYMRMENEAVTTRNPLEITPYLESKIDNTEAGIDPLAYPTTDWRKELFKDYAHNQRMNFSLTGGGAVAQYYLAGTYNQDNGILKVDGRNNFNNNIKLNSYALRSNVSINVTKTTEVGVRLYGTFDDYTGPIYGGAEMYGMVMRSNPVLFPAYYPATEDYKYVQHIMFGGSLEGNSVNPYAELVKGYKDYSKSLMLAQFEMKQNLAFVTEGLTFRGMLNTNRESYFDVTRAYNPFYYDLARFDRQSNAYTLDAINPNSGTEYLGYAEGPKIVRTNLYAELALNYSRTFADKHGISGLLVYNMRNFLEGNASSLLKSLPYRNMGLSGRATYAYDDRYFAEFNFGYNGSERFYIDNRFGFFPSAGVAWSVSNEKFWEGITDIVPKLKLRATYGLVGNDAIGSAEDRFFYLSTVDMNNAARGAAFGTNFNYVQSGVLVSRYDNRLITWETATKTNLGLEFSLWNQFDVQADYFTEYRKNILMDRASIPVSMGLSAPVRANVGEASGKGVDFSVDFNHTFSNGLWLIGRGNFTYATSSFEVIEEPEYNEPNLSKRGYSLSQQWGYIAERLFIDEADVANSPVQNFGIYEAGDIKYRDVNGDGKISSLDQVPIGYPTDPEIIYGFGFSAGFKGVDFSCFFQGSGYSAFWINQDGSTSPFVNGNQVLKAYAESYWSEENRNNYAVLPRLSKILNDNNNQLSTWFMRDGSFLRLKSVELGYTLPQVVSKKMYLNNLRVYLSGTNLANWSKFKLWDVEMGNRGLGYPIQQVYNFGVQVGF
ncbi:SusC/RagA family TonB-linked outer membrane protein [Parapedobacter pyrenivorans]|uniref:SusC/RagA family TonB-linked outer membrane protein n=1 Tax=Parapedobacter pyrenivorans TaxID=1305674 RepID=A0A917I1P6_9SPHI|nr:TonB-dependent receptor [Parapedobacter pyrenivorans]GGH03874.1 SusC/RagA family TonB-linked outer membrane protein [Parapedobacter pyrenivorans]